MSKKRLEPPTIHETTEAIDRLRVDHSHDLDSNAGLRVDKGGSDQLSVSEDSRRQSLFADDDTYVDRSRSESEISSDQDDDEDRKRKRQEEVFIDKARAAVVVIGTKDIKEALERKKAVEIHRKSPEAKSASILYEQAQFLMRQGRFQEAVMFLNRALNVDAVKKEWLTEKSRCFLNLLQPDEALKHVNSVLKHDPHYFRAIVLKGEIYYSLWDLERSMLCFVEGRRMRPDDTDCILGMHKVKMALAEIADFRAPKSKRKRKRSKVRSKSAKGRLTSVTPSECLLSPNREVSPSSRRPSLMRLSPLSDGDLSSSSTAAESSSSAARPSTAAVNQMLESPSISRSQKIEFAKPDESTKSSKAGGGAGKGKKKGRPKTAVTRRSRSKSRDVKLEDIRKFVKESMSGSYKSSPLRVFSGSTERSSHSNYFSQSFSSSMEDLSEDSDYKREETTKPKKPQKRAKEKKTRSKITPGTKIYVSLAQDKAFLDGLLKDRDLRRTKTAYTKRALKIAYEVQRFVVEREKYWKNRERFVRYASNDDGKLL